MTEDHHPVAPGCVFLWAERAAEGGSQAEDREVFVGDARAQRRLGSPPEVEVEVSVVDGGQGGKRPLSLLDVDVVTRGGVAGGASPGRGHDVDPFAFGKRQGPENHGVQHAEDRGGSPEAQGQGHHREGGKGPVLAHLSQGEAQVLAQLAPPLTAALVSIAAERNLPAGASRCRKVGEPSLGGGPGRPGLHSLLLELAGAHLEVEVELVIDLAVDRGTQEPGQASPLHVEPQAGRSTRDTAAENSAQALVSRPSSLRPSRVRR